MKQITQHSVRANGKTLPIVQPSKSERADTIGGGEGDRSPAPQCMPCTAVVLRQAAWMPRQWEHERIFPVKKYFPLHIWNIFPFMLYLLSSLSKWHVFIVCWTVFFPLISATGGHEFFRPVHSYTGSQCRLNEMYPFSSVGNVVKLAKWDFKKTKFSFSFFVQLKAKAPMSKVVVR